jgi:hypothetical protein
MEVNKKNKEKFTSARLSFVVRDYLAKNSLNFCHFTGRLTRESVDDALRRILGIKEEEK